MLSSSPSSRQGILDPRTFTFWHYQVSGWILMYCADLAITSLRAPSVREFLTTSLEVPLAFLLSLLLREVYATIEYKALSIVSLIGAILLWSAVFTVIWYALATVLWHVSMGPEYSARMLHFPELIRQIDFLVPIWVGWSSLYFGINYWRDWEVERERARKAVSLARRAQLEMLRYQLNPHFLFNALNSVRALVDEDRAVAKEMVTELSAFLRYSLSHNEAPDVPLSDELAAIKHYLSIEKRRFEDKLDVRFDIQPDAERFRVLSFLVHPLVENAVKYGMKTSSMPLHVGVSARLEEGALALTVSNSGSWYRGSGSGSVLQGTGTGLENVKRRLENAYAGQAHADDGGGSGAGRGAHGDPASGAGRRMMKARMNIRSWGFWHFQTLGWSLFATSHFLANILSVGVQSPMVWWFLLQPAAGFVVTLGMREVYRNIRYQQIPILLVVFLCVLGGATAAMISLGVNLTIARLLFGPSSFWEYLNPVRLATSFSFLFPVYMVWCVLYFGIRIWSDYLGERDRADEAVASAQQAQMQMLRYHLHPHFLFNTLNSVRALIDADPPQARAMITELSEFLRYSLISRNRQEVTIAEEMQAVHQYLSLEKRRFENKLEVSLSIEDGARERTLPSFLIHPLVENAIIHGMRTSAMPLRVSVTARVREFGLSVEVTNTGRWLDVLAGNGGDEPDTGLENVRARLAHVYPGRHRFSTFERDGAVHAMLELLPRSEQLQ